MSDKFTPYTLPKRADLTTTTIPVFESRFGGDEDYSVLEVCGDQGYEDRITDGTVTNIDEFPWMALLKYETSKDLIY